ncbi:putative bifunctional diguanylate cyclase/phosphodiesterase [Noviherbaspirillum galbum]|uniref:EAL domain-containing protein n=1 Tax=Noviherbaspirillum galbum TaxID=2709383 RepID=A0A6B3SHB5_9BURK|nr:EAL domain-containing protein [Noviherbaspirillum galbum]NEX60043.1 EAL domain-containing protein [Noviherbaspirillum galbum]
MPIPSFSAPIRRVAAGLDTLFDLIGYHIVPIMAVLISLVALIVSEGRQENISGTPLPLQAQIAPDWTPEQAMMELDAKQPIGQFDTNLSEKPVWFHMNATAAGERTFIELPSRHARTLTCWDGELTELGRATRTSHQGSLKRAKAGFALELPPSVGSRDILCRGTFVGPAHLTAAQLTEDQLAAAIRQDQRRWGMLDGGMLVLAVFVGLIAILSRESIYVLFAGWICLNLRIAELSAGWDTQWLGEEIPTEWLSPMRAVTIALFAIVTCKLYQTLFGTTLKGSRTGTFVDWTTRLSMVLLPAAIFLPFATYLPIMWVVTLLCLAALLVSLGIMLLRRSSPVAMWFAGAFSVTLISNVAEVAAAAAANSHLAGTINAVTGAIASTVLIAVAIAERIKLEHRQFIAAKQELEAAYEANPIGLFTVDTQGRLISANPATYEILGMRQDAGPNWWLAHLEVGTWTALQERLLKGRDAEVEFKSRDGTKHLLVKARLVNDKIEGFLQDITAKALINENLFFMAHNDPLTRALNRRGIELEYKKVMESLGNKETVAIAYLDLDRFKLINDLFGHASGDDLLVQVADRSRSVLSSGHVIGRVGGDEFLIMLPKTTLAFARVVCQGIVTVISDTSYKVGDHAFNVHASIGLIECTPDMELADVIASASRACQEAKSGGDHVVAYERSSSALFERRAELALADHLTSADATLAFFLEMQPIMSLNRPTETLDFEVLLRMRGRDGSIIPAGRIIGVAEKGGLMGMIDRWVLSTTLGWIERNIERLPNTRFVCMNLSGASLNDERFILDALDLLDRHAAAASHICLEITESVALHDLPNTVRFINQVRERQVRVALDDFGAGYTSFSYLKDLPADVLKIDGNFISKINENPANVAIVEAIVRLANNLGMKTIAEWAEDAATVRTLASIGVDYVQGFAIARSQQPDAILVATSAASFIKNAQVMEVVQQLAAGESFEATNVINMHEMIDAR